MGYDQRVLAERAYVGRTVFFVAPIRATKVKKLLAFNRLFSLHLCRRCSSKTSVLSRLFSCFNPLYFLLALLLLTLYAPNLWAWPANNDWIPIYRGTEMLADTEGDTATSRDIVGDTTNAAAYLFNDGNYIYFRVRLDSNPVDNSGTALDPFGWGFLLDLNQNLDDYEYMILLDGIANPEVMYLARNSQQGIIGDASDKAEVILWQENLNYGSNYRVLTNTDSGGPTTQFGSNNDFFIDYFIPYDVFKNTLGLTESSVIRYFVGSANNAMVLSADLVAGSTLYDGSSNFVLPSGKQPTTGSVSFVTNSSGTTDLTEFYAGATVYLKVIDADLNSAATTVQTVTVSMSAPSGDTQTVTLTETGVNTGIFTGPLLTSDGLPVAADGILQVTPIEIITVTYIDGADGTTPVPLQNQTRTDTARALPAADIAVAKSVNKLTPNEGETITYTIRATNLGPSGASGIQVTDLLPAGITYVTHSAPVGTSYNPGTGLWTAGSLVKDAYKELTITATVNTGTAQTTIRNTASRSAAAQPDPNSANDSAFVDIAITGADLSITKTVNNTTPAVGGTVRFTLTVTNDGTYPATNVVITDLLPTATWSSVSVFSISQGTTSYSTGTLTWNIGSINYPGPGNSVTLVVDATLAAGVASGTSVTNTATISHVDQKDPHPGDDTASATLVVGGIDLSISKVVTSPNPATPNVGDTVVFTVTVTNSALSSTTATGVEITDLLPADLTYVSHSASEGTYATGSGKWNNITLAPNESQTLTLTTTVKSGTAGRTISNTANITAYNQTDVNTANHSASASVTVKAADLRIVKTVDIATPADATNIIFTITLTNIGTTDVASISVFDQLPGQVDFVSASPSQGTYSTTTFLWSGISLTAGSSATLTMTVTVNLGQNEAETFFNTASLYSSTPEDNNATNDVSSAVISVNGTDLGVTKSMNTGYTDYPASGTNTQFLITLTNYGPKTATDVTVKDLVPIGLSCASATVSTGSFNNNGSACDWTVPSLVSGLSATMILTSAVTAASGTTLTNRATITAADQADPSTGNNSASKVIYVGASDLSLAKSVDVTTPNIGGRIKFTITLTNNGTNSVSTIQVTDLLPAGLTLLTAPPYAPAPSQGTYTAATGVWSVGTVNYSAGPPEVKGSATLDLYATIDSGTAGTVITNEAHITAAGSLDPNTVNNRATASITVQQADVYVNKEANSLTPYVGETVTFTITAGNNGPNPVTNLIVRDLLATKPDSFATPSPVFTGLIATPSQGSYDSATGNWSVGTLAKNATATLTLTATLAAGSEGKNITNTASKVSADQTDSNTANNSESIIITPQLLTIDLRLTKSVDNASPVEGNNVTFTLTLYNLHGSRSATGVVVTDTLPAGLTFVSASTATGTFTAPAVGSTGDVVWTVGSVGAMSNVTLILTAKTGCGSVGSTYTNSATVSAKDQIDPDLTNNTATKAVTPTAADPNITLLKMVTDISGGGALNTAKPGQIITYRATITNLGCGQANDFVITDELSPYVEYQLDSYGSGMHILFEPQTSGLSYKDPVFYQCTDMSNPACHISPILSCADVGVTPCYDNRIIKFSVPMGNEQNLLSGRSFSLRYKVKVK